MLKLRGGATLKRSSFLILPLVILAPITLFALIPSSLVSFAANPTNNIFPDQTIDITQGDTEATVSFNATIENVYTDGYDVSPNLTTGLSTTLPTGVAIKYNYTEITETPGDIVVREYRTATTPTDDGQIEYTITVPADAPAGDNYAIITLDYTVDDFVITNWLSDVQTNMNNASANSLVNMQQLTPLICASANYDSTNNGNNANNTITLIDTRNNQNYQIRKLPDNHCWMINNLKLGSTTAAMNLTPADTNITAPWTLPQVNAGGAPSTTNSYNQPIADAKTDVAGAASLQTDNTAADFYGYYYNWCAATAGGTASGGSTNNTCTNNTTMPTDSTSDICPKNWRLPRGGQLGDANNEFSQLNAIMAGFTDNQDSTYQGNSTTYYANFLYTGPFHGVLSGNRYSSSWGSQGSYARLWSGSHYTSANNAFFLHFSDGGVAPGSAYARGYRFAVRCVLG